MTNAEWNETVQRNYNQWSIEEREKAMRLYHQRQQMKSELQNQMQQKAERDRANRYSERAKHQQQLAEIEKKLIQDQITAMQHDEKIR